MPRSTTKITLALTGAVLTVAILGVTAVQASGQGTPLQTNLNRPRGIVPLTDGEILLSEAGSGRVWRVLPDGTRTPLVAGLPVNQVTPKGPIESIGVVAAAPDPNGGYKALIGGANGQGGALWSASPGGTVNLLVDLADYEQQNNTDGFKDANGNDEVVSNPYDLVVDSIGNTYITDAGANAVLRYSTNGNTDPYYIFSNIPNPLYPGQGLATIHQAPTGITIGPDGAIYVATMTVSPYPQGEARVYRLVDKNMDGDARDADEATVYATGLTAATDVAFDAKGVLHVSQYSTNMLTGEEGRISKIVNGLPQTVALLLTSPTAITFTDEGHLIVTEESIGRVADLTGVSAGGFGSPITSGVTLTTYVGGSVDQLTIEAKEAGATAVAVTSAGKFVVLVPGAPSFVNQSFKAKFPSGVPGGTVLLVVRP